MDEPVWLTTLLFFAPVALGVLTVGTSLFTSRSCPACRCRRVQWLGSMTFEGFPKTYLVFRCTRCQLELIATGPGTFDRRDTWRPAPGALPRAFVRR